MKKRYTEEQIIKAIKSHEAGTKVSDICRDLELENTKLKKLLAENLLEVKAMKDVLSKKG